MPPHFVAPPQWERYIVWYFFFGGIAGGAYVLGTLLRLFGDRRDGEAARLAFLISFPAMAVCPILLTLDLGRPDRFWHMLVNSRTLELNFKYWSPMSVGAWVLLVFGVFAAVSFVEALPWPRGLAEPLKPLLSGGVGRVVMGVGALFGLFLTGYTGVLLSVTNQPIWSDTWALGGLFLASGLSVAAAAIGLAVRLRRDARGSEEKLARADRYFILLELALLVVFFLTLGTVGSRLFEGRLILLWVLVLIGTLVPLVIRVRSAGGHRPTTVLASGLVLIGGLALRMAVIFGAQM